MKKLPKKSKVAQRSEPAYFMIDRYYSSIANDLKPISTPAGVSIVKEVQAMLDRVLKEIPYKYDEKKLGDPDLGMKGVELISKFKFTPGYGIHSDDKKSKKEKLAKAKKALETAGISVKDIKAYYIQYCSQNWGGFESKDPVRLSQLLESSYDHTLASFLSLAEKGFRKYLKDCNSGKVPKELLHKNPAGLTYAVLLVDRREADKKKQAKIASQSPNRPADTELGYGIIEYASDMIGRSGYVDEDELIDSMKKDGVLVKDVLASWKEDWDRSEWTGGEIKDLKQALKLAKKQGL